MIRFLLWLGAFCLFAGEATATNIAVLVSRPVTWNISGVGNARTLKELGTKLTASPSANVTQIRDYDGRRDGAFQRNVVTADYSGTMDCQNHVISNALFINYEVVTGGGTPPAIGFFKKVSGGTVNNCDIRGAISQNGTDLNGNLMTYRVGGFAGYSLNATYSNNKCQFSIYANGYFNYNSICFADVSGTTAITTLDCSGSVYITVNGNNAMNGCIGQFFAGTLNGLTVHDATFITAGGTTQGQTQTCATPPCATTGSYMGAISTNGYTAAGQCVTVQNVTVAASVSFRNAVPGAAGITGTIGGNTFCATVHDSVSHASAYGDYNVGGAIGKLQSGPPSGGTPSAEVYNLISTGDVTCVTNSCGRSIGLNSGYAHHFYGTGRLLAPAAVNCGEVGRNFTGGQLDHYFGFNLVSCNDGGGGVAGRNDAVAGTTIAQAYTMGRTSVSTNVGAAIGVCGNLAGISSIFYNSTWASVTVGCGSADGSAVITAKTNAQLAAALPAGFDSGWQQHPTCGYPVLKALANPTCPTAPASAKYVVMTTSASGQPQTAPNDYNPYDNVWMAIGPGGNGADGVAATNAGASGGGGVYAANANYAWSSPVTPTISAGGSATATTCIPSALSAKPGSNAVGTTAGGGGTVAGSLGDVIKGGGNGSGVGNSAVSGGGGGAGGPSGAGKNAAGGAASASHGAGGGGGAANGGSVGVAGVAVSGGGNGGAAFDTTAGGLGSTVSGSDGGAGSNGSGGGGGYSSTTVAGKGGAGSTDDYTGGNGGSGSGAGGSSGLSLTLTIGANGANGGQYGGGGSGGGRGTTTAGTHGVGGDGACIVKYVP